MKIQKNQKVFLAYAFTGQDAQVVEARMERLYKALQEKDTQPYCNLFDEAVTDLETPGQYEIAALQALRGQDVVVAIKPSEHRSEGQLMELGAAKALGIPYILCVHESAVETTYLDDPLLAAHTIVWDTEESLVDAVRKLVE